jgi:hypothetical protein
VTLHFRRSDALEETDRLQISQVGCQPSNHVGIEARGCDLLKEKVVVYGVKRLGDIKDNHGCVTCRLLLVKAYGHIYNDREEFRHRATVGPVAMLSWSARE